MSEQTETTNTLTTKQGMVAVADACYGALAERDDLTVELLAARLDVPPTAVERVLNHGDVSAESAGPVLKELGIDPVRIVAHENLQIEIVCLAQDIDDTYTGMSSRVPDLVAIKNTRELAEDLVEAIGRLEKVHGS